MIAGMLSDKKTLKNSAKMIYWGQEIEHFPCFKYTISFCCTKKY